MRVNHRYTTQRLVGTAFFNRFVAFGSPFFLKVYLSFLRSSGLTESYLNLTQNFDSNRTKRLTAPVINLIVPRVYRVLPRCGLRRNRKLYHTRPRVEAKRESDRRDLSRSGTE